MRKKTDVTFIRDLVEQELLKNPNGLVSIPFASKMENYLRKFVNTRGSKIKSIITDMIEIQEYKRPYPLQKLFATMLTIADYSDRNIKVSR